MDKIEKINKLLSFVSGGKIVQSYYRLFEFRDGVKTLIEEKPINHKSHLNVYICNTHEDVERTNNDKI